MGRKLRRDQERQRASWAPELRRLVAFGGVSIGTTLLDLGVFNALLLIDALPVLVLNTVAYGTGVVASYLLNKHLTFSGRGRDRFHEEAALFVLINIVGLVLNNAAVALAAHAFEENTLMLNVAKLAAGMLVWVFKYLGFKRWVYPAEMNRGGAVRR